jgi:nucleotide-binding universal stress UspA family protein
VFAPKRILVPVDFGEPSAHALQHAMAIADRFGASLDVLHVVPNPYLDDPAGLYLPLPVAYVTDLINEAQKRLSEVLAAPGRERLRAKAIVKVGDPSRQVVAYAESESVDHPTIRHILV